MEHPWYHTTTIYQIYPRSFQDTNGDGIGDLPGIIQRLDHIKEMGFETIWISPFFASPQSDFGYDIAQYTAIAPEYGTMDDALMLISEVHTKGMRIVFDMVMNHTSVEHEWFKESRSSRTNPSADWYLWRDQPNNWQTLPGGSGWHYAPERGQYYWASFLPFQPDLNYRNPDVKKTMLDTVRFWLSKGVDGFRLDIFNVIYKDAEFRDNPFKLKLIPTEDDPSGFFQDAKYTVNQPESFEFARELRSTCEEFGAKMLLGEVSGAKPIIRKYLGDETNNGLGLVFDFEMLNFKFTASYFRGLIERVEAQFPDPFMPVYVFSNHDRRRSIHRLGEDIQKAKLLAMLQLTVRGVPCIYYGEEIGMTDLPMPFSAALDPMAHKYKLIPRFVFEMLGMTINRDEVRTPMQWNDTKNAGFSTSENTWLPVHDNYPWVNVEKAGRKSDSLMMAVRALLQLRAENQPLSKGTLELINNLPKGVLGYIRRDGTDTLAVFLNFEESAKEVNTSASTCLLKLSGQEAITGKTLHLPVYGGAVLKVK